MSKELDQIFDTISKWSVEDIRSFMHHGTWSRMGGVSPLQEKDPPLKAETEKRTQFDNAREEIKNQLKKLNEEDINLDEEEMAKLVIAATFFFIDNEELVPKINTILENERVKERIVLLLNEEAALENELSKYEALSNPMKNALVDAVKVDIAKITKKITKMQLFYVLHKQRESLGTDGPPNKIVKVTWDKVTSKWGPKIVQTDTENFYYVFKDIEDFDGYKEKYNIASKLGETPQYRSVFEGGEDFGVQIIQVLGTKGCTTLDVLFLDDKLKLLRGGDKQNLEKVLEAIAKEFFRHLDTDLKKTPNMSKNEFEEVLPRLRELDDPSNECYKRIIGREGFVLDQWRPLRIKVEYGGENYHVIHGDEWPGNFLINTGNYDEAFFCDFEDAIYANIASPEKIESVGGDLASRIYSEKKDPGAKFTPAGLNIFGSIGRLMAAIVQYTCFSGQADNKHLGNFLKLYLAKFKKALENKQGNLVQYWDDQYQSQILLHAWDWALYWKEKTRFGDDDYAVFIEEIRKLLCPNSDEKVPETSDSSPDVNADGPPPSQLGQAITGPNVMPESIQIRNIERADGAAWDDMKNGDYEAAGIAWGDALQMLDASNSVEDKGYYSYWKSRAEYRSNSDEQKAIKSVLQCIEFCKEDDDIESLMDALLFLAYLYRISGGISESKHILDQIVHLYNYGEFDETPNPFDKEELLGWLESSESEYTFNVLCRIKRQIANFYWATDDLIESAKLYENLMDYYKGVKELDAADLARVNLGILKSFLGEYEVSDELQNECLDYRRKEYAKVNDGDTGEITKALRNLGQNAMAWRKFEKAKQYFTKCIDELRKVPPRIVPQNELQNFIQFSQNLIGKCDSLIEIRRIQVHEKDDDKVNLLIDAMNKSQAYKTLYVMPILSSMVSRKKALNFANSLDEEELSQELKLKIARLMYNKFLQTKVAKRLLASMSIEDLNEECKVEALLMHETIFLFSEPIPDGEEFLQYHSKLQKEYNIEYPSIIDKLDVSINKKEVNDLIHFFINLPRQDPGEQRIAIYDFFESGRTRLSRHLLVRIMIDCAKGGGKYRDILAGNSVLSATATTRFCLNNVKPISKYYIDSYNDVFDFLTLVTYSAISYAEEHKTDGRKLNRLNSRLSDLRKLYQTKWLDENLLDIVEDIFSYIGQHTKGAQLKFDTWSSLLNKIIQLPNTIQKKYMYALLHTVMIWDSRLYDSKLLEEKGRPNSKFRVRMKMLANTVIQWIRDEPDLFKLPGLEDEDPRRREARWLLNKLGTPECDWPLIIQPDFDGNLD